MKRNSIYRLMECYQKWIYSEDDVFLTNKVENFKRWHFYKSEQVLNLLTSRHCREKYYSDFLHSRTRKGYKVTSYKHSFNCNVNTGASFSIFFLSHYKLLSRFHTYISSSVRANSSHWEWFQEKNKLHAQEWV